LALGKEALCRVSTVGSRQRLTGVNFWTAADGPLPRAPFAECLTLGKGVFAEWGPVPSVQHSVKRLFAESLTLPRVALGKAVFAECPIKGTRQRGQHSAKPRIPVVIASHPRPYDKKISPTDPTSPYEEHFFLIHVLRGHKSQTKILVPV
jgi:hypothetical protein